MCFKMRSNLWETKRFSLRKIYIQIQAERWFEPGWLGAWPHLPKRVDKRLRRGAIDEGVDDIGVGDVGQLITLPEEAPDVLS